MDSDLCGLVAGIELVHDLHDKSLFHYIARRVNDGLYIKVNPFDYEPMQGIEFMDLPVYALTKNKKV